MAENTPAVNLNKAWLQNFLDNDVIPFKDEIRKIGLEGTSPVDGVTVPALVDLVAAGGKTAAGFLDAQVKPLAIGTMASETAGRTNGGNVTAKLDALIAQVTAILKQQGELFDEIEDDLKETIEKMFKTQGESLDKIDGKKFVDFFEDVDGILSEGPGSGNEDND